MNILGDLIYGSTNLILTGAEHGFNTIVNLKTGLKNAKYTKHAFDNFKEDQYRDLKEATDSIIKGFNSLKEIKEDKAKEDHKKDNKKKDEDNSKTKEPDKQQKTTEDIKNHVDEEEKKKVIINEDGTIEAQCIVKDSSEQTLITQKEFAINGAEKVPVPEKMSEIMNKYGFMYDTVSGDYPFNILQIYRGNVIEMYPYETGSVFGNGINILYINGKSIFPISLDKDPDIFERYINVPNYIFTQDDINRIMSRLLPNYTLYRYLDFKDMDLNKLSDNDRLALSAKLTGIFSIYQQRMPGYDLPRFRFRYFKSIDDFGLASDEKVNRPKGLVVRGLASSIINGDSIHVMKDSIIIKDKDKNEMSYSQVA